MKKRAPLVMETPPIKKKSPNSTIFRTRRNAINKQTPPLSSISDLRGLASSQLNDLRRHIIDRSHSEILKDLEASHSRLHKRFKIQNQTCEQVMEEADKDFKKMAERINENLEAMKESYAEFVADAEATNSRVCKSIIPEVSKSIEKVIAGLHTRYGVSST